ncbi:MAG: glycosyltransferase family 2 protein [Dehalococcoidia bacterium]|nr:glycosyltransferase family 2 protein [Dehalococcoidia bacterium]
MSEPKVSVIICCYTDERLKDIHEAVDSVLAQTLRPHELIIAVDHNKQLYERLAQTYGESANIHSNSANLNQSPGCQFPIPTSGAPIPIVLVLNEGAQGLSETRNVGLRAASGDIVAFIDDDAVAEKDWLLYLSKPFEDERVVAVGGRAIPLWLNGGRPSWFPEELDWIVGCTYEGLPLDGNKIRNVAGCNMAFLKEAFAKAGLWDTRMGSVGQSLKGGEEAEMCLRFRQKIPTALILWEPKALINHKVPLSRAGLRWVIKNSYDQGTCKVKVTKYCDSTSENHLSTEGSYLRYLLSRSVPGRLARFYHKRSLLQAGAILVCIAATGAGYLVGRATIRSKQKNPRKSVVVKR